MRFWERESVLAQVLKIAQWTGVLVIVAMATGLGLIILANVVVWGFAVSRMERDLLEVPEAPTAIVLGAAPGSPILDARLDAGVALWKAGKVKRILVSGGTDGTGYGETEYMWRYVRNQGVPESAITVDSFGVRTLDSVLRAHRVFGFERAVVVTQRFHLYRAIFLARCKGLQVSGYVADPVPTPEFDYSERREIPARVMAVVDVLIGRKARFGDQPPSFANHPAR